MIILFVFQDGGMVHLISDAAQFPWQYLDDSSFDSAAKWQLERSDPRYVLGISDSKTQNSIR